MENKVNSGTNRNSSIFVIKGIILMVIITVISCQQKRQEKVDELARKYSESIYSDNESDDESIRYENVHKEGCQVERSFIIAQAKKLEEVILNLEKNYKNLSIQDFEKYLSKWNRDIEIIRDEIDAYNYNCFKYNGIKRLSKLTVQLGLGYIYVVMYNDNSDVIKIEKKIEETKNEILTSMDAL